ncbi:hypothetical protein WJX73_005499 [Symbiochloris irregularis]|uniref:Uncharacterized protein n=1 Tax=Symbiochloris irregularis TaxID=706552 RepID=A0AAW1NX23_9CHLO
MKTFAIFAAVALACASSTAAQLQSTSVSGKSVYQPSELYSNAVVAGNWAFLAGVGAPATTSSIEDAVVGVLGELGSTLQGVGGSFSDVISGRVFLANISDYDGMNTAWTQRFSSNPPARTVVEAANPGDSLVEIELTAYLPNGASSSAPAPAPSS